MRLSEFIESNREAIVREWESFAKTLRPAADHMDRLALRDHIEEILTFIAADIESSQTSAEQVIKSHGNGDKKTKALTDSAAQIHGTLRHGVGFDMVQMVSEYRALRASIIKLWSGPKVCSPIRMS